MNKLLDLVMAGEQDDAEKMIKANPQLLNHKGSGKEWHSGREFKSITAFQYALWALDWYMWDMMMKHIDHFSARSQLEELERQGTEHGKQFDGFDKLIKAYQVYIYSYDGWNYDQRLQHWTREVGGCQKALPIHALQEYWRKDRSMDGPPDFKDKRGTDHDDLVEMLTTSHGLGAKYGVVRAALQWRWCNTAPVASWDGMMSDRKGIVSLKNSRNTQYKELRETISKASVLHIR